MFLDGWKQYSLKSKLQKSLLVLAQIDLSIKSEAVGVLVDSKYYNDENRLKLLADSISKNTENELFIYAEKRFDLKFERSTVFSKKDFSVNGKIKNEELNAFIRKPFKLLISYYHRENVFLEFVTFQSKAAFKVGLPLENKNLNDLTIKTDIRAIDLFEQELIKYLKILNRID